LQRILPGVEGQMCVERHGYADGPSSEAGFLSPITDVHSGLVQEIILEGINNNRLVLLKPSGHTVIFQFSNLIFASGTIGNAILVSRVTGAKDFSIGNHASSTIGHFEFRKPQNLSAIQQAFHLREREFLTFSHLGSKWQVQSAIRMIPNRKKSVAHEISLWFRNIFTEKSQNINLWKIVYIILDIIRRVFGFGRLEPSYKLRILAEVPISSQGMHVTAFDTNSALIKIDMSYTAEAQGEVKDLLTRFTNCAISSELYSDVKITSDNLSDIEWEDSGHYFGTVPVAEEWEAPSVDGNLKLRGTKSIWVIGNSAHPVGSHGHPTALSILLAKRLAKHLVDNYIEQ
jgi:GMC oxidoreductase